MPFTSDTPPAVRRIVLGRQRRGWSAGLVVIALGAAVHIGCQKSTPSVPPDPPAPPSPPETPATAAAAPAASPIAPTASPAAPTASASAAPPPIVEPPAPPPLRDDAGVLLPQTEDQPSTDSAFFARLGPALWKAIVEDDASVARSWFFPIEAYHEVKAIADPDRDWETRLWRLFESDIHDYRMQLGKYRSEMQYVRIEVPSDRARWMKPHSEGNKLGYWRVLRAQLVYLDREQRERRLEITSMISWRGEWYVVHLNGFQ